jgi:hypothetical protein
MYVRIANQAAKSFWFQGPASGRPAHIVGWQFAIYRKPPVNVPLQFRVHPGDTNTRIPSEDATRHVFVIDKNGQPVMGKIRCGHSRPPSGLTPTDVNARQVLPLRGGCRAIPAFIFQSCCLGSSLHHEGWTSPKSPGNPIENAVKSIRNTWRIHLWHVA